MKGPEDVFELWKGSVIESLLYFNVLLTRKAYLLLSIDVQSWKYWKYSRPTLEIASQIQTHAPRFPELQC